MRRFRVLAAHSFFLLNKKKKKSQRSEVPEHYVGLSCFLWQLKKWFISCEGQQRLFKPSFLRSGRLQGELCWEKPRCG